jgi:hypothetical protein
MDSGMDSGIDSGACPPSRSFCNGSCVDEQNNSKNCGACGHDCLAGPCSAGACQSVTLVPPLDDSGQAIVSGLAVDSTNVYWTVESLVMKCSLGGCSQPTVVASGQASPGVIRVASGDLYWTTTPTSGPSAIMKCAQGTCAKPTTHASYSGTPIDMAVNSAGVFWLVQLPTIAVMTCPFGGCTGGPHTLTTDPNYPSRIAVDSTNVYWTDSSDPGFIMRCPVGGCMQPIPVFDFTFSMNWPFGIAVSPAGVYWTNENTGTVSRCSLNASCPQPTNVAQGQGNPADIALDMTDVYWINKTSPATVNKCPLAGCGGSGTTVASQLIDASNLAVGLTAVVWSSADGSIVEVAK